MQFAAPWSSKLKLLTAVFTAILLGVPVVVLLEADGPTALEVVLAVGVPLAILVGAAAFMIRGYSVRDGAVWVHRLGWATRIPLGAVRSAEVRPGATVGSLRTFGIGGLFGFSGRFRNDVLGAYRAYVTDGAREVVLETEGEPVVLSPDRPAAFVEAIRKERRVPA